MTYQNDPLADLFGEPIALPSAVDAPLTVTTFRSVHDREGEERQLSLRELADLMSATTATEKRDLPLLVMASFGQDRGQGVSRRNAGNVQAVYGVEGDHDAGTMTLGEAAGRLRSAGIAALLYDTPSSTPEAPRWRVLSPTSEAVAPSERVNLVGRLNAALDGALAPESFRLAQSYYFGRLQTAEGARSELVGGRPIDLVTEVEAWSEASAASARDCTEQDLLAEIEQGRSFHQALTSLVGKWLRNELGADECVSRARAALERVPDHLRDQRWRTRFRDVPRIVRDLGRREARRAEAEERRLQDAFDELEPRQKKSSRLRLLRPADCDAQPSRGYVVKGLIAPRDVACIFGPPGAGKSLLAPFIAYQVARGAEAFGMRTKQGRILYVAAEDPHGMAGRISALRKRYGDAPDFILVDGVTDLLTRPSPDFRELRQHIDDEAPALVFLDTLAMSFPGLEENSADGMGRVVAVARALTEAGAAVVLIHHDTKAGGPTPRGHSLLNGALDVALQLAARDEEWIVRASLTKNRNGPSHKQFAFRIETEDLGVDEDGDKITAPIAAPTDADACRAPPKLTASEKAALKILKNISDTLGRADEEAWRVACIESRAVSGSEDRESRRKAVSRAFQGLARKAYARFSDGRVWLEAANIDAEAGAAAFDDLAVGKSMAPLKRGSERTLASAREAGIPDRAYSAPRSDATNSSEGWLTDVAANRLCVNRCG